MSGGETGPRDGTAAVEDHERTITGVLVLCKSFLGYNDAKVEKGCTVDVRREPNPTPGPRHTIAGRGTARAADDGSACVHILATEDDQSLREISTIVREQVGER